MCSLLTAWLMSLMPVAPGDATADDAAFPAGRRDASQGRGQQLDRRSANSWTLKLEEVSTAEMACAWRRWAAGST